MTEQVKLHIKYKETLKRCQKRWTQTERGREMTRKRNLKYYYRKKNIYHPELNVDGEIERKYKKKKHLNIINEIKV